MNKKDNINVDNNIDVNIIKEYLNFEKDNIKLKSFLRLYSNYSKINKFSYDELSEFENEVYTIEGRTLTDKERIMKEIVIIESAIKKVNDRKVVDCTRNILNNIKLILNYDDSVFEGYISFLKKSICELQAILKLDINFYNTSCELFDSEYENIKKKFLIKKDDNYNGR